jgi:hypothetical protein
MMTDRGLPKKGKGAAHMKTKPRTNIEVKMIVQDWKNRMGSRPYMFGPDIRQAMVAQCVLYIMKIQSIKQPNQPMIEYIELYDNTCEALGYLLE